MSRITLLSLPNELLISIAKELRPRDLYRLILTNQHLAFLCTPVLHDLASEDKDYQPALHWASNFGYLPLIKLLLKRGTDINLMAKVGLGRPTTWGMGGFNALHYAIHKGASKTVELLLQEGADVNSRTHFESALHLAAVRGNTEIVKMLLESGADVNSRDCFNKSPLFKAVDKEHESVVRLLLESGAVVHRSGGVYPSELDIAEFGSVEILDLLNCRVGSVVG